MAAKKSIEYEIYMRHKNIPYLKPVRGYPITLPVSGTFAVRRWNKNEDWWTVDHVDTGFAVADAEGREEAIDAAIAVAKRQGEQSFAAAIAEAKKRRESIPQ